MNRRLATLALVAALSAPWGPPPSAVAADGQVTSDARPAKTGQDAANKKPSSPDKKPSPKKKEATKKETTKKETTKKSSKG